MNRLLHGLVVGPGPEADLRVTSGADATAPAEPPRGAVHAAVDTPARAFALVRTEQGWTLWFRDCLEIHLDAALTTATTHRDPRFDEGLVDVLTDGFLLATVLQLRGHLVLHASAVEVDGRALAVVGPSGRGKSTLATLLCRAGAALVTDDVLRVDLGGRGAVADGPVVRRGATSTRLRAKAADLAAGGRAVTTADARLALALTPTEVDPCPLDAVLLPRPRQDVERVEVVPRGGAAALTSLLAAPRILGWRDPTGLAVQMRQLAGLVAAVPVMEVHVPWGPPFADDLGEQVLAAVRQAVDAASSAA